MPNIEDIEDKVKHIIEELPSEASGLDYKLYPYDIKQDKVNFLKDIIAMLNSEADIGEDKFIIIGIEDKNKYKNGIDKQTWHDDNEWQHLVEKISSKPLIYSGTVDCDDKTFGYFCISKDNTDYVYELKDKVEQKSENNKIKIISEGQAFFRQNSQNVVLFEEDRRRLLEKASILKLNYPDEERYVSVLALVGSWNEQSQGDLALIKSLLGTESNRDVKNAMAFCTGNEKTFRSNNKIWQCKVHKDLLLKSAKYITVILLEKFFEEAGKVFLENGYSKNIRRGIAESIAILGNNLQNFKNIGESIIQREIYQFENKVFRVTNWETYATSIADEFEYFGDAAPGVFLDQLERLFETKDQAFYSYLKNSKPSLERQLSEILSNLAKIEDYFSRSMRILLRLAEIKESFLQTLTGIVSPIFPQTHARWTVRTGVFKGLAKINKDLTWKALIKIINNPNPSFILISKTQYLSISAFSYSTKNERLKSIEKYVEIACTLIDNQVDRMCEMVEAVKYVPLNTEEYIIEKLNENLDELSQKDREKLWNKLQDLLLWSKKHFDENEAPIKERLEPIKKLSEQLENKLGYFDSIRLFNRKWFPLLDGEGEWKDQEKRFFDKREITIKTIYREGGLDSVIAFAKDIEDKLGAGRYLAKAINDKDLKANIENNVGEETDELIEGLVPAVEFNRLTNALSDSSDRVKAKIYACLPISNQSIEKVVKLDVESAQMYWNRVFPRFVENDISLSKYAIKNFNQYGRADKSIEILSRLIENKDQEVPKQMVIDTLKLFNKKEGSQYQFFVERLLLWLHLQKNNDDEITCIKKIEWKYLSYITGEEGCYPKYLQLELSNNPEFFVDLIRKKYEKTENADSEEKLKIHVLLNNWRKVPGLNSNGLIDIEYLNNWIIKVRELARKINLEEQAMQCLGRLLFYSPEDKKGLFINRKIADILENNRDIRTGYLQEGYTFSFCGFNGELEKEFIRKITKYHSYALQADEEGWINLAKALRNLENYFINEKNK